MPAWFGKVVGTVRTVMACLTSDPPAAEVEAFLLSEVRKRPVAGVATSELADAAREALPGGPFGVSGGAVFAALSRLEDRGEIHCRVEPRKGRTTRRWFPCGSRRPKASLPTGALAKSGA